MTIRGIVFDIGGVLEYTPSTGYLARWTADLGLDILGVFKQLADLGLDGAIGNCTEAEWQSAFRKLTGMDEAQFEAFMVDVWVEYLGTLNVELVDYVRQLRPHFRTGILSNSFLGAREKEQAAYGFEDLVDVLIYSHEVGLVKPDPAIYALTCQRIGVKAEDIVFVDDVMVNIEGARAFGMHGVLFEDNDQVVVEIEHLIHSAG